MEGRRRNRPSLEGQMTLSILSLCFGQGQQNMPIGKPRMHTEFKESVQGVRTPLPPDPSPSLYIGGPQAPTE